MNNPPLVSICIPTYNQTTFLKKTLDSIFLQEFTDYELIISDDSTNDEVKKLVSTYPPEKIKYTKNAEPLGSPKNWNITLEKATGKYVKILHHDDWFSDSNSLTKFVQAIKSSEDIDFVFSASYIQKEEGVSTTNTKSNVIINKIRKASDTLLTGNVIGSPSATLFKKTSLRFDERLKWLVDIDFYIQIIKSNNFVYLAEPLIYTTDGATHQITNTCKNKEVEIREWFYIFDKYQIGKFNISEMVYILKLMYKYKVSSLSEVEKIYPIIPNRTFVKYIIGIEKVIRKVYEKDY